jgi:two-component system response regulator AtoC
MEVQRRVLVVDDEQSIRDSLRLLLKSTFDVQIAENGTAAVQAVEAQKPDIVLLDVIMPELDGIETLRRIKALHKDVPVVMLSATNTVQTAVQALKLGAVDFVSKPFDVEELTSLLVRLSAAVNKPLDAASVHVEDSANQLVEGPVEMVGNSAAMQNLRSQIERIAERDTTVLITGESGTGKELVAKMMHQLSSRKKKPFIAINCAAIPETLIESELFGHEKGAFTHAVERRIGYCELANGGTLFLDEIGELSLNVQVKLLRFLQEQEFFRIGRSKPIKVDVRIICATNKTLEEQVRERKFREDLYYRVNVVHLTVPALRDRFEDIPELVAHFGTKLAKQYNKILTFTPQAMERCVQYSWPGNVRELENTIESLLALTSGGEIGEAELPRKLLAAPSPEQPSEIFKGNIKFEDAEKIFESEMIIKALKKTNYVQTRAAELLGISRRILKYKMDKLGISDVPGPLEPSSSSN